jgi:hypothetical protein
MGWCNVIHSPNKSKKYLLNILELYVGKIIGLGIIAYIIIKNGILVGYKIIGKGLMMCLRGQSENKNTDSR